MSGSEGSSTKQSTSRVSQGRLDGASEGGNAWLAVTTADARIPIKNQTGENPVFFISAGKKKTAVSLSSGKIDYPEWYTEKLEITEDYYKACAYKKGGIDGNATQKIAELTALSQISAYIGTNIQINSTATVSSDSTDTEKYLYKTMDKIISRKIDYELCNLQKNENQGITFVQIEVKRDLNSEQP